MPNILHLLKPVLIDAEVILELLPHSDSYDQEREQPVLDKWERLIVMYCTPRNLLQKRTYFLQTGKTAVKADQKKCSILN